MRTTMKMLTVLRAAAGGAVPVITTDAVIGTQLDAGEGYDAYQWQSSSDGATWADISGATAQTYTPTDAVFGLFLRVEGDGAASNATGRVAEVPVQTLGVELLTNGTFSTWSGDNPTNWSTNNENGTNFVTESSGAARMVSDGGSAVNIGQSILSVGSYYQFALDITARTSGSIRMEDTSFGIARTFNAVGSARYIGRAANTQLRIIRNEACDMTMDNASVKALTPNAQLTAPSADMRLTAFYTLPASPVQGDQVWLVPRISDFSAGNYWLVLLEYTGSQWNITVYSVASHVRTQRIAATAIGVTNGVRVNMNGTSIALETTADGGDNWTSRGTPATNTTYQTATGVSMLHTSAVTPGNLLYEPAV